MPIALYAHRLEREERERQKAKRRELENVEYITETDYAVGPMRPLDENFKSSGER
ncbi:hypothetical protein L6259_00920 [Candidatus Parcubacteria bacterium]|nr:hypothetical protein [Patescibacteria group bacterium]MCG2693835.1 hypothetical protein [Candidatus Parcubacteria bacterium]